MQQLGHRVTPNQEPGGTPIGKDIRRILLDPANSEMASETELLLMFASRTQAAAEMIRPALLRGEIVLSDRWTDSSLAYQGAARGLGFSTSPRFASSGARRSPSRPHHLCINRYRDWPASGQLDEIENLPSGDQEARIDQQSMDFHRKVGEAYRAIAQTEPERFRIVDGSGDAATVFGRVWDEVAPLLDRKLTSRKEVGRSVTSFPKFLRQRRALPPPWQR